MRRIRRAMKWAIGVVIGLIALAAIVAGRPTLHLLRTSWADVDALPALPAGQLDDASRQNLTAVHEIIAVETDPTTAENQLRQLLARARAEHRRISIAGSQHTMGGHTIYPGGIAIEMSTLDSFELDDTGDVLRTQAGATWAQIIPYLDERGKSVAVMQSNNSFTVGGSISVNCHGWPVNRPPIASTVRSFRIMLADGTVHTCSRAENSEIFSLALGGYGLFGIILDVELEVVANEACRAEQRIVATDDIPEVFQREVIEPGDVALAYARLRVTKDHFLDDAIINFYRPAPGIAAPPLCEPAYTAVKRSIFRGSAGSEYGKQLRWDSEAQLSERLSDDLVSRNTLLNDPVELYQDRSEETVDILHEYFIPPDRFKEFLAAMRTIIPRHGGDLLNVTVRHVNEDTDTFLRYADREMIALVLMFCQQRTAHADEQMQTMTRELIDAALALDGRHYLPYRLHATPQQFEAAYPMGRAFFALKRKYDPGEVLRNYFYEEYGAGNDAAMDE